ncbi:MAG TPA: hypothetical protein ENN17_12085 [bacterium]|nr:hypothetical protein [bacterium]
MKTANPYITFLTRTGLFALFLIAACSSELFNLSSSPVIERIEASAYEVDPGDTVTVKVIVKNDNDDPLQYTWTATGGRIIPPVNESEIRWIAPARGGIVTLQVTVANEKKSTEQSILITVRSHILPQVQIVAPKTDAFIVQNSLVEIRAVARHDNGIQQVDFIVDGSLCSRQAGTRDDNYRFEHRFVHPSGPLSIVVKATANVTGDVGADSVRVHVEGIILGKPGD